MAEYQKYMFDNFVVASNTEVGGQDTISEQVIENEIEHEHVAEIITEPVVEQVFEDTTESNVEIAQPEPTEEKSEPVAELEPAVTEKLYSEEELNSAVDEAKAEAYEMGRNAAADEVAKQQNILLEDIKNQLMMIFAGLDSKTVEIENASLKFALGVVRKILPTLEKERAEAEIKTFLSENFANFSAQDSLSFAFNPDTVGVIAGSLGRLAEQNDFEGKISVHKDVSLGPSDCRIEWKNGGVERITSKMLGKIETIIDDNAQERGNG